MALGNEWVLFVYRLPREPSTPRIAVWRKLRRLGVAQLGDGVVAVPGDARTKEQVEWIAEEVLEAGGEAMVWLARPASTGDERRVASRMAAAVAEEYAAVLAEARTALSEPTASRRRTLARLRRELGRIARRDFFPPPERATAQAAVGALAAAVELVEP